MRKFIPLILLLLAMIAGNRELYAQTKRRPLPDWVFEKPQRSNSTFYYHVEKGTGETETEARNAAYTQAFMQVALKLGIPLNTEDISEAVASGTNVKLLSQRFTIPMNVACYTSRRNEEIGGWNYWLLCQIPEVGYADRARFDDFNECFKFEKYEAFQKKKDEEQNKHRQDSLRNVRSTNGKALAASVFIPGVGQMYKANYTEGALTLAGEGILIGGGVTMLALSKQQKKIMNDASGTLSYADYTTAKNKYNAFRYTSYGFFGAAAVLYGVNLWRAWACTDKRTNHQMAFYPTLIPEQNGNLALGLSMNINF